MTVADELALSSEGSVDGLAGVEETFGKGNVTDGGATATGIDGILPLSLEKSFPLEVTSDGRAEVELCSIDVGAAVAPDVIVRQTASVAVNRVRTVPSP